MRLSAVCQPFPSRSVGWFIHRCAIVAVWVACAGVGSSSRASELRRTAIVKAVEQAKPSIVNIQGEKTVGAEAGQADGLRRVNGMGTGVVVDERGYILTNHHVIDGVSKIRVTLSDNKTYTAVVVSRDPKTDLAVIKIDGAGKLPVIRVGTSSDLMAGESVIAVGNAYGYPYTITRGIVSALHRTVQISEIQTYEDLIQTDASINPGNSGGPLLNIDGDMIGVNVAVRAGAQGIGFAIPVDKAMAVAADLLSTRRIDRTWHGVLSETTTVDGASKLVVSALEEESPAAQAGLRPGDRITAIGEQKVCRELDFERALLGRKPGEEVEVSVDRDGKATTVSLVLAQLQRKARSAEDSAWETLGVRLKPMPGDQFKKFNSRYRGGLNVLAVRPDSPAAKQGIRRGDVLVGMHVWETVTLENVSYILGRSDFADLDPIKFYIIRDNETLYGHLPVSMTKRN